MAVRVYELAKELGIDSKALVTRLGEMGQFVRSPSSTIDAPVVRRVREAYGATPPSTRSSIPRSSTSVPGRRIPQLAVRRAPRLSEHHRSTQPSRSTLSGSQRAELTTIFGERRVQAAVEPGSDGYGGRWVDLVIDHDTYTAFFEAGLGSTNADLAYDCLMAGLRPADLPGRLGETTVLGWLLQGYPASQVADTLRECRNDPASAHLIDPSAAGTTSA